MESLMRMQTIDKEGIERIVEAAYTTLEKTGVDIHNERAREYYAKAGCQIDGKRVRISRELVKKCIETAPSVFNVYDRNGNLAMEVGRDNRYVGPGPTCPYFIDPRTGERRFSKKQDAADTAKVTDALPNMDYAMSLCIISDTTEVLADLHEVHAMLQNTTKPLMSWSFNGENLKEQIELCAAAVGGMDVLEEKPILMIYSEPTTPLSHTKEALDKVMIMAEHKLPCIYTPGMAIGAAAPVTIAGALVVGIADSLTGLVLSQLVNPGAPIVCAAAGAPVDMKTMQYCYGSPEWIWIHAVSDEIFRYLDIPRFTAAGCTDSKVIDAQAGIESAIQVMMAWGTYGNLIHDAGFTDFGMTGNIEQTIICDEIYSMIKHMFAGYSLDDDHIGLDVIDRVGPQGCYIAEEHTAKYFRETWTPDLTDRYSREMWDGRNMQQRAHDRLVQILDNYQPEPMCEERLAAMQVIIDRAEARVK